MDWNTQEESPVGLEDLLNALMDGWCLSHRRTRQLAQMPKPGTLLVFTSRHEAKNYIRMVLARLPSDWVPIPFAECEAYQFDSYAIWESSSPNYYGILEITFEDEK